MIKNVCFIVGHGEALDGLTHDPGATRFGFDEFDLAREIASNANKYLASNFNCSSKLINYDGTKNLNERINMFLKKGSADLVVEIHLNSTLQNNVAYGTEAWYYPGDSLGLKVATAISQKLATTLTLNNRGAKAAHNQFGIVEKTAPTSILVETAFISSLSEVHKVDEPHEQLVAGQAIAEAVASALGLSRKVTNVSPKPIIVNPTKPLVDVANEVIQGRYGNGAERVARLTAAGYKPKEVQDTVELILNKKPIPPTKNPVSSVPQTKAIQLSNEPLYTTAWAPTAVTKKTGMYFYYDNVIINGRRKITNSAANIGKQPVSKYTTGFIKA